MIMHAYIGIKHLAVCFLVNWHLTYENLLKQKKEAQYRQVIPVYMSSSFFFQVREGIFRPTYINISLN